MDLKQYIPQIIASVLVLAGGGTLQLQASSLQSQASDKVAQEQTYATSNGEVLTHLLLEVSKLKDEISALKGSHQEP